MNKEFANSDNSLRIVYTPLHGSGLLPIKMVINKIGYKDVYYVESQIKPDGNFPTVKSPNPEENEAFEESIKLSKEMNADIILGTDPDADRVGVVIKDASGNYKNLTGNQIGALLTYYMILTKKSISDRDVVIKTIVTSDLGGNIVKSKGGTVIETLTGFKYIGEKIKELEIAGKQSFLFGYEESYGYLAGTFVRDKDAIIASVLILEMANYFKMKGMTLFDVLENIYKEYGYYSDHLESYTFKGVDGKEKISRIVGEFRNYNKLISYFDGVVKIEDYAINERYMIDSQEKEMIELPEANVIKIYLEDDSWFAVRPSGTEPKLKVYISVTRKTSEASHASMENLKEIIKTYLNEFMN
ncbi:MAG: phospho-sugar mutase [Halanaerobiales bacterium]|nr:phospho-sugar mutase [Halanaerobiales bacterium]